MALRELLAVVRARRARAVTGRLGSERAGHLDLLRRIRDVVAPRITCVIRVVHVLDRRGEVVRRAPIGRRRTRSSSCSFGNSIRPRIASCATRPPSSGMRKRIASLSSNAEPSTTSPPRRAPHRPAPFASSRNVTGPSQSIPSHRSDPCICSTDSVTSRLVSVFSMRSRHSPLWPRANSQSKRNAARRRCGGSRSARVPCGRGRTRWRSYAVLFGAEALRRDQGLARPGRGDRRRRRPSSFVQCPRACGSPSTSGSARSERFGRAARRRVGGAVRSRMRSDLDLTPPRRTTRPYEKSVSTLRSTVDAGPATEAHGVAFHVGVASGRRLRGRRSSGRPRIEAGSHRTQRRHDLAVIENSAGAGATIGRLDQEPRVPRPGSMAIRGLASASSRATSTPPVSRDSLRTRRRRAGRRSTARSAPTGCAPCTSTTRPAPLARTATRTRTSREGEMGEKLGVFLADPGPAPGCSRRYRDMLGIEGPRARVPRTCRCLRDLYARWKPKAKRKGSAKGRVKARR